MADNETKTADILEQQSVSLYVGDLDPTVNAIDLYNVFCKVGYITGLRICYDYWGHSLGYGYVNFYSPLDAAKAMSMLNHTNLKGKSMRIMWCERNPLPRKTGNANLYVKNLDPSINSTRLDSIFSKFGTVVSCKVAEDEKGKSKGFGFVQFDKEESAMKALNSLHDTLLEGKKLYISNFMKSSQRKQTFTNLYVKSLKKDVTEDDLKKFFSNSGKVKSVAIMRYDCGLSKGFGFVEFESAEDANKAMEALNGTSELAYGSLYVGRAQKKAERKQMMKEREAQWRAATVFVNYLNPNVDDSMLKSHFSACGKVIQAKVLCYANGISKGFGWVTFSSPSEAMTAVTKYHGRSLPSKPLNADVIQHKYSEGNCPISVRQFFPPSFPYHAAGNNASQFTSVQSQNHDSCLIRPYYPYANWGQINGKERLNSYSHTANGEASANANANATAQAENHKLFPKESVKSTCCSTRRASTAINVTSCKNLHMVVPKAEPNYRRKIAGMKLKQNEHDQHKEFGKTRPLIQFKQAGKSSPFMQFQQCGMSSPLMQQVKVTILEVFDRKNHRGGYASSTLEPLKLNATAA